MDEMLGELRDDLRLGFRGWPFDLRMIGVLAPDSSGEKRPLPKVALAMDAERLWPPFICKFLWALDGRYAGLGEAGIIDDEAERVMGDGVSTSLLLPLAKDDVK